MATTTVGCNMVEAIIIQPYYLPSQQGGDAYRIRIPIIGYAVQHNGYDFVIHRELKLKYLSPNLLALDAFPYVSTFPWQTTYLSTGGSAPSVGYAATHDQYSLQTRCGGLLRYDVPSKEVCTMEVMDCIAECATLDIPLATLPRGKPADLTDPNYVTPIEIEGTGVRVRCHNH